MPQPHLMLGVLVFCLVTPWILADTVTTDGKIPVETTTFVDDTRREDEQSFKTVSESPLEENGEKENHNETQVARMFLYDSYPAEEITDFTTDVPCDNAQFLLKILTVMLPLLRNEVPESTRTSYILLILKDLLKSTPEAGQDYEIMYKINDLILTLDKYHNNRANSLDSSNLLRNGNDNESVSRSLPDGVKSKVVFKYEVPQLPNPDCTSELLMIIKVVQQAILRLVNNPLCKTHVPLELPFYVHFKDFFKNPDLYSHLPDKKNSYNINNVIPYGNERATDDIIYSPDGIRENLKDILISDKPNKKGVPVFEINFSEKKKRPMNKALPYYPYESYSGHSSFEDNPYDPYDESPTSIPLNPGDPSTDHYNSYSEYPDIKYPIDPYSPYRPSHDPRDKPPNIVPLAYDAESEYDSRENPPKIVPLEYDDGLDYIPVRPKKPKFNFNDNVQLGPSDSSLDVYGDANSAYIPISHSEHYDIPYGTTPSTVDLKLPTFEKNIIIKTPISQLKPSDKSNNDYDYILDKRPNIRWPYYGTVPSSEENEYRPYPDLPVRPASTPTQYNINQYDINYSASSPLPIIDDHYDEISIGHRRPDWMLPYDWLSPTTSSPFDVYRDEDFDESNIALNRPKRPGLEIIGSHKSAYIPFSGQYPDNSDIYLVRPGQKPNKPRYDSSPDTRPTINGEPEPKPKPSTNHRPNRPGPYNPYLPNPDYDSPDKPFTPIDVTDSGSGEIEFDPSTNFPITNPENYYNSHRPTQYIHGDNPPRYKPLPGLNNRPNTPEYYWPNDDEDNQRFITNLKELNPPLPEDIISDPVTKRPWLPDIENQYVVPYTHEEIYRPDDFPDYAGIPEISRPVIWSDGYPNDNPSNISPQPGLTPDKKILLIIKDNIDVMEQKIPEESMTPEIQKMIRRLKGLLDLEQITVEEYVNIINKYQVLIEYVKHLNIGNAIMKELLLSMTNVDKLDLQTGKSHVIELTYLIKRPTPLIYQPYYYIKYRLPYTSFLKRIDRLLAANPYLKKNPSKLYKALIPISKLAETSPDLKGFDKDDILRLTFNNGTLVGAKVVKGKDVDLYNSLDQLQNINSDFTVDDIYRLIKNLDAKLRHTQDGLILENSDIPALNIAGKPDEIHIKVNKHPILEKVTKITTNKLGTDKIIKHILNNVKYLRTSDKDNTTLESTNPNLTNESSADLTNENTHPVGRTRDVYEFNSPNEPLDEYNPINKNIKIKKYQYDKKSKSYRLPSDYLKALNEDINHYPERGAGEHDSNIKSQSKAYWNQYPNDEVYYKNSFKNKESKWLDYTHPYNQHSKSYESKPYDIKPSYINPTKSYSYSSEDASVVDSKVDSSLNEGLNPIVNAKLLEATLKGSKNNNREEFSSQKYLYKSPLPSVGTNEIINGPKTIKSHLVKHSETYINGVPLKHSKTYLIEKTHNIGNQYDTQTEPTKYNVAESSQAFTSDNSYIDNYNPLNTPNRFSDFNSGTQYDTHNTDNKNNLEQNQAYISDNSYIDGTHFNGANNGGRYVQTQPYINDGGQAYISDNSYANKNNYNLANSYAGGYGAYNQNLANNLMKTRYRYIQRWPFVYPLGRKPRLMTHPLLG